MIEKCLMAATLLWWAVTAGAQVTLDAVPGGVTEIPLAPVDEPRPDAYFGLKRILVMQFGPQWVGLVGLPLDMVPGKYVIQVRSEEKEEPIVHEFTVHPRRINEQVPVQLPDMPLQIPKIDLAWREPLDARLPLNPPVSAPATPTFGRYQRISDSESVYLQFVTFRVDADTSVAAPGNGRVAAVRSHDTGTFVWIDHGMALFTCIGPMTRTTVKQGDRIELGRNIGKLVLDTMDEPRFLYWSVFFNGTAVNPFLVSDLVEDTSRKPRQAGQG